MWLPWLLKCKVKWQSAHYHRQELPEWLLRPSFSSEVLGFTNCSLLGPEPHPLRHLGSGGVRGPISTGEAGEGGVKLQLQPTWPPTRAFPPPAAGAWPLSSCSCSSQTPPQPVARGLVSVCGLGQPQWGLSWSRRRLSFTFRRTTSPESGLGRRDCVGGSDSLGC